MKIAVLCDFDGTIALDDVGNLLFRTFADARETGAVVDEWKRGDINSRQCLEREAALARVSREDLSRFIAERKLDPYFKDFCDFTRRTGMEMVILSDGLDHYIQQMLIRNGLGHLDFFANVLEMANDRFNVTFPHYDMRDCQDCGNCKTWHLEKYKAEGYFIVYVGNGRSDRCPATYSDLVFAKEDLLPFCEMHDVNFVAFRNFRDVERELVKRFVLNGTLHEGEDASGA